MPPLTRERKARLGRELRRAVAGVRRDNRQHARAWRNYDLRSRHPGPRVVVDVSLKEQWREIENVGSRARWRGSNGGASN